MSDFNGFVKLMIGGVGAVGGGFGAFEGEVAVQLDHGVARSDGFVGIDLDFVIVLGARGNRRDKDRCCKNNQGWQTDMRHEGLDVARAGIGYNDGARHEGETCRRCP
jgi:hypothetical protein